MPILIGVQDEHGRYRTPLMQQEGQWQPRKPRAHINAALQKANSVYDLPSIEQAIKWMHAVCGYPVKSTWLKQSKQGTASDGRYSLRKMSNVLHYLTVTSTATRVEGGIFCVIGDWDALIANCLFLFLSTTSTVFFLIKVTGD